MSTAETVTARDGTQERGHWRRMRVWASAHAVDDFYQGLVPAAVPYFVLERRFSYLGASGLALAATLGSALPQLAVGDAGACRRPGGRGRTNPQGEPDHREKGGWHVCCRSRRACSAG